MSPVRQYDAIVVGAGPNGLAAGITLAQAGRSVLIREARDRVGGAAASDELTLPGFIHDTFSAAYPLTVGSPYLQTLPLERYGLEWVHSEAVFAHPFDDGSAALLERSIEETGRWLGGDASAWRRLHEPLVEGWDDLAPDILDPIGIPRNPVLFTRFGLRAMPSVQRLCRTAFDGWRAPALFSGSSAHSGIPLHSLGSAAYGMMLNVSGHAVGWPIPRGGAGKIPAAMAAYFRELGGEIELNAPVRSLDDLPRSDVVLLDLTPRQVLKIVGDRLPGRYRRRLEGFRYGAGVFKMDWALSEPIPWRARECLRAATVHLGGRIEEIATSERAPQRGEHPEHPYVLLTQPTIADPSRAPEGKHIAWAYCHVPNGSSVDMSERIEAQIERFAPGFRDVVLARSTLTPVQLEALNENLVGGDVNGGSGVLTQLIFRPVVGTNPYATPVDGLYICSASTPPGGGVHGMCGHNAAKRVLAL